MRTRQNTGVVIRDGHAYNKVYIADIIKILRKYDHGTSRQAIGRSGNWGKQTANNLVAQAPNCLPGIAGIFLSGSFWRKDDTHCNFRINSTCAGG
jgi:hypothetical protein